MANIAMLGTGLIGMFYTMSLTGQAWARSDCRQSVPRARIKPGPLPRNGAFPIGRRALPRAVQRPEVDIVIVGLPNYLHQEAVLLAAQAGKAIFCTKPLGRNAAEAKDDAGRGREGGRIPRLSRRPGLYPQDVEVACNRSRTARSARCCGPARARRIPARTAIGSGRRNSRAAARSWIWAATASRSAATSSARM